MKSNHHCQNLHSDRLIKNYSLVLRHLITGAFAYVVMLSLTACGSGSSTTSTSTSVSTNQVPAELRDYPYCEVIPNTVSGSTLTQHVFNTLPYGPCSSQQFATITEQDISDAYNSAYAANSTSADINGPRAWVLDQITATGGVTSSGDSLTVNGIKFGLTGMLTFPVDSPPLGSDPYVPYTVNRNTIYLYRAGTLVYELTDPSGNVYVMQAYSKQIDPTLTLRALSDIGPTNQLAAGWTYASRRLVSDLILTAAGSTTIVNDHYANTYQINPNP